MKKVVLLAFVLSVLSTAFSLCAVGLLRLQIAHASPYTDIDVETAYNMITNGSYPDLVVLDVMRACMHAKQAIRCIHNEL